MKHMKLMTIALAALAFAFGLSGPFALAKTLRHKPGIRTHDLQRGRAGLLHPNYGNPDSSASPASAGGYLWNGRSGSEWGGG